MRARLWNRKQDYDMLLEWWRGHKCDPLTIVPNYRLPPSGWIVEDDDGNPVCITWLYYFEHVSGAMLGNVLTDPDADITIRYQALDLLFLRVTTEADRIGCDIIFGVTTREGIFRKAKRYGFVKLAKHSVEFQRELGGVSCDD